MTRASLLTLHRRLALVFAPLLLLQALTGAALLFKAPLGRLLDPAGLTRESGSGSAAVTALLASAEQQLPGYHVNRLYLPKTPADIAMAQLTGPDGSAAYASLDPGSAKVLAAGSVWRFPLEAAVQLHYRLNSGSAGLFVVLANGLALAMMTGTGLGFWWPGRQRLAQSLIIRRSAPARVRQRQQHRFSGVFAALLLLFSATTGILLVVPDIADAFGPAPSVPQPLRYTRQIDPAVAIGAAQFPQAAIRDIRFPLADRIDINFFAPQRNPRAVHIVSVRLSDLQVTKRLPAAENPVLWMKLLSLHTGESFGLIGRLLLLAEAMVLVFLTITGPIMWWRGRGKRK